jgi:hypothetical protein
MMPIAANSNSSQIVVMIVGSAHDERGRVSTAGCGCSGSTTPPTDERPAKGAEIKRGAGTNVKKRFFCNKVVAAEIKSTQGTAKVTPDSIK